MTCVLLRRCRGESWRPLCAASRSSPQTATAAACPRSRAASCFWASAATEAAAALPLNLNAARLSTCTGQAGSSRRRSSPWTLPEARSSPGRMFERTLDWTGGFSNILPGTYTTVRIFPSGSLPLRYATPLSFQGISRCLLQAEFQAARCPPDFRLCSCLYLVVSGCI